MKTENLDITKRRYNKIFQSLGRSLQQGCTVCNTDSNCQVIIPF